MSALAALVVAGSLLGAPASTAAVTPQRAVQLLNSQRVQHGIPGGIAERPDWSDACRKHNDYLITNGTDGHEEDPSRPGYTSEGAWAGQNAVIGYGDWELGNPFENAPIHLAQLLTPHLAQTGIDQTSNRVCATTFPGYTRPYDGVARLYSYPGQGAVNVPFAQNASESPFVPGDFVGLPQGTTTGPHLYVFGPPGVSTQADVTAASLASARGGAEVRWVDNTTPSIGPYLPQPSAILIPVAPLNPGTTYTAHVSVSFGGGAAFRAHDWSFTTAERRSDATSRNARLRILAPRRRGRRVSIRVSVHRAARGTLRVKVSRGRRAARVRRSGRVRRKGGRKIYRFSARLPRGRAASGRWRIVVRFRGSSGWSDARRVRRFRVRGAEVGR